RDDLLQRAVLLDKPARGINQPTGVVNVFNANKIGEDIVSAIVGQALADAEQADAVEFFYRTRATQAFSDEMAGDEDDHARRLSLKRRLLLWQAHAVASSVVPRRRARSCVWWGWLS